MTTTAGSEAGIRRHTRHDAARAGADGVVLRTTEGDADAAADAVEGVVSRMRAGLVSGRGWQGIDVAGLGRLELLATHRDLARMQREIAAMLAVSSSEIGRRSTRDVGPEGLAKREGFGTPEQLIASMSGGTTGEAHKLIEVGDAMNREEEAARLAAQAAEDSGLSPRDRQVEPPASVVVAPSFAAVGQQMRAGKLSIDVANIITRMLTRLWDRREVIGMELADVDRVERMLVERAYGLSANKFADIVRGVEARMDSDRHALTEELQYQERSLKMFEDRTGMFILHAKLDAETAAPVRAAIEALVGNAMHQRRDNKDLTDLGSRRDGARVEGTQVAKAEPVAADDRSAAQMGADALAALARHCLGCDSKNLPLDTTTVVVRLSLADLQSGTGVADIDGASQPVSASTARRMAANGKIIPLVLGGDSEILDLGHGKRNFNYYQRIALIERDGGCAFCGAPPSWTEAHHIRWWSRDAGLTDLDNGLLLCSTCHHRIHRDHWDIDVIDGQVWFTPPRGIDPQQKPRLGGRARFHAPTAEMPLAKRA